MKRKWIFPGIGLFLVILLTAAYVSRNQWVALLLRRTVESQSGGQVVLKFKKVDVAVFSRKLTIEEPTLLFHHVYFNKVAGTMLKKAVFHSLALVNISLWDILWRQQFIIDDLVVQKPEFSLEQTKQKEKLKRAGFDPTLLIKVMQDHEITELKVRFLIHRSQIKFGKIEINGNKGSGVYGSAHYFLSIENMGTIGSAHGSLHPLTFKRLDLAVRNFRRYSAPERLDIAFDSAFYSSQNKKLFLNGLRVDVLDKNPKKPPLTRIYLRWTRVGGLNIVQPKKTGKPTLHLNEIKMVGAKLVFRTKEEKQQKKSTSRLVKKFFASYRILALDTLALKHLLIYQLGKRDTLLKIKRLNFELRNIWADKQILNEPLKALHFGTLLTSCQELSYIGKKGRIRIHSGKALYDSRKKRLMMNNLLLKTYCKTDTSVVSVFKTKQLSVNYLSCKRLQKGQRQLLAVNLMSPNLNFRKDSLCHSLSFAVPLLLKPLKIREINVKNGNLSVCIDRNLQIDVKGMNLFADSVQNTKLTGPQAGICFRTFSFNTDSSRFRLADKHEMLKTGRMAWDKNTFKITRFLFARYGSSKSDSLRVGHLTLSHLRLNPLVFHRTFIANSAYFYKIVLHVFRQDSMQHSLVIPAKHWNSFVRLPFKTNIGYVRIRKSSFSLTFRKPGKVFEINSRFALRLHGFKMGYDSLRLISNPQNWEAKLQKTFIRDNHLTVKTDVVNMNSGAGTLLLHHVLLNQLADAHLKLHIDVPSLSFGSVDYGTLMKSDSLVFGKVLVSHLHGQMQLVDSVRNSFFRKNNWHFVYDSLQFNHARLDIGMGKTGNTKKVQIVNLNLLYHPNMRFSELYKKSGLNLINRWDLSLDHLVYSDLDRKFKIVADRIAVQSAENRAYVKNIMGTNFSSALTRPVPNNVYNYFLADNLTWNGINLRSGKKLSLDIKNWTVPGLWVNIINNDSVKRKRSLTFLNNNFFNRYTQIFSSIHVDSSIFSNVNLSYQYDHMRKLVNFVQLNARVSDIQLGRPVKPGVSGALFGTLYINLYNRPVISGDSMYTFRTRDILLDLPDRRVRFDSITITPRFDRKEFFARAGVQTDRVTLYGKNIILDHFHPDDLLNEHFIHFGNLQLNNLSLRFERDMRYRRADVVKPMPLDFLRSVPYKFRLDSLQLKNSLISYFEYEKKSKYPGIFFIDDFNVLARNLTNHLMPADSNLVLQFKGSGRLMKQANLNFTLVMPYYAPHEQWWFSAEAGKLDLTQFNPLTENVLGISIISGKASLHVPMITGNNVFSRGNVDFLYNKLKLRLYSRKKSQKSKSILSPFANFLMNNIMINSNNPPFLGHVKKGVVYYKRVPQKSFINFLWKSNLSGILSTIGFNNKQQREVKREEKKQTKTAGNSKQKPKKKN